MTGLKIAVSSAVLFFFIILTLSCGNGSDDDDSGTPDDSSSSDDTSSDDDDTQNHWVDDSATDDTADDTSDDAADDSSDDVVDDVTDDTVDDTADDTADDDTLDLPPGRYVIIGAADLLAALTPISELRSSQGYSVETIDPADLLTQYTGYSIEEAIRQYLIDTYVEPNGVQAPYLLLAGGYSTIPMPTLITDISDPSEYATPTDSYYADIDVDWDANGDGDIGEWGQNVFSTKDEYYAGRIPSDDAALVAAYAEKAVAFETDADSEYKWKALLLAGYIAFDGDSAIIINLINDWILAPAGYDARRLFESGGPFPGDGELTRDSLLDDWGVNPYGFVMWASHGGSDGTAFIRSSDSGLFGAGESSFVWSSACSQVPPDDPDNIGASLLLHGPAANFIGSTNTTHPGDLGEGSLIFMIMVSDVMVHNRTLGVSMFHSKQEYLKDFWFLPYPRGIFLRNYYGFSILGDPALTYWPKEI